MKKRFLIIGVVIVVLVATICLFFIGRDNDSSNSETDTSTDSVSYEYVHRDVPQPGYIEPAIEFAGGDGSAKNPYQISNAAELALLSKLTNDKETNRNYYDKHYVLTQDIYLNECENAAEWDVNPPMHSWNPISEYGPYSFEGILDGQNHSIFGMYINEDYDFDADGQGYDNFGLFGEIGGTVCNLNLKSSYICVSGMTVQIGGISGKTLNDAKIKNCFSDAKIICYDAKAGGIVGENWGTIDGCVFDGELNCVKQESFTAMGGVAAYSDNCIINCKNIGNVICESETAETMGGIVALISDGTVENCANYGKVGLLYDESQPASGESYTYIGGISGKTSSSTIGGDDANKDIKLIACTNEGEVICGSYTAGIVAGVNNDHSEYEILIKDCINSGKVFGEGQVAGVVADAKCSGAKLTIQGCKNMSDIDSYDAAGIVNTYSSMACIETPSEISISDCKNTGKISSHLYSAGIINQLYLYGTVNAVINIDNCLNTGDISGDVHVGGIIGIADTAGSSSISKVSSFNVNNCVNKGTLSTESSNAFVGGIVSCLGTKGLKSSISDSVNLGTCIVLDIDPQIDEFDEPSFALSRMAGGIVGRIGDAIFLTTDGDNGEDKNVNKKKADIVLTNCYNAGEFDLPSVDKYCYKDGTPVYENHVGGIVGNCAASKEYAFCVEDCKYANAQRGLGTKKYTDVGTKTSVEEILNVVS